MKGTEGEIGSFITTQSRKESCHGWTHATPRDRGIRGITLMRRMESEFEQFFNRYARHWPMTADRLGNGWRRGPDVEDKEDSLIVRAEAPGFEVGDFDIQLSDNRLILRTCRKKETKEKESEYQEQCECYESMPLPPGIDKDKIDARYHNGILTITIPKTAQAKAKRIAVKS